MQNGVSENVGNLDPFIDRSPDYALYVLDTSGKVVRWTANAERLKGYTAEEIIGRHFSVFFTAEDEAAEKPWRALEIASREGACQEESWRVRKDGTRFWATVTNTALKDETGKLQGFAELVHDFTECRIQDFALLRARETKYRGLYQNSPDAIFLTSPGKGAILAANPTACKLSGYPEQELVSLRREHVLDMTSPKLAAAMTIRHKTGEGRADVTFICKDGGRFEARISSKLYTDENGQQVACTVVHDITERKEAEEALRQSEERFRMLFENAPLGIIQIDQKGNLTSANRKFAEISGYSPQEAVGLTRRDVTVPEERAIVEKYTGDFLSGKIDVVNSEGRLLRKDESTTWVRQTAKLMRDKRGRPQSGMVVFEDITERKQAEEALRQSEEKFRATFEHVPLGISECTVEGRFMDANPKLLDILGYTKDELLQLTVNDLTHPGDMEETLSNLQKMAAGEANSYVMEKRYIRKDRSIVWVNVTTSLTPILGKPKYMVATIEDITARKKTEAELKRAMEASYYQANHDTLTGLANRTAFNDRLKEALAYAKRDGHLVALHVIDLDGFKSINDTQGHHIGDLLLKDAAKRIRSQIRATDLAARMGGDEFVVIQTHLAEPAAAGVLAGKLVDELGRTYMLENQEVHSGTSIGIAIYPNDTEALGELIKQADLALYDAKHRGRFNFQFYREELGEVVRKAQQLEQELVRAWRENEFCLHYQPQFDLKSGRITGIEALLRWHHPTRGTLAAADFIYDLERLRLMRPMGEWVLQTACRQYKEWGDAGLAAPLTVNLSATQLRDPRFLQTLRRILDETGLPASLLQLETQEGVLWDPKFSKNLLEQIEDSGLHFALDDFGTDLTALSALNRFPLDAVKSSRGLVKGLPSHKWEATVLAAIIGVAHNQKMTVCANGVETTDQLAAVKEQGCDSAQGYLLSEPLDTKAMTRLVEKEIFASGHSKLGLAAAQRRPMK
jgi:diguanylate cyclase (GGDEF)-like protein/PAS domain S-box-containing protein